MSREESFNFLEILSDIEEEYVREANAEENAVQPQFIQPRLKRRKPLFAIAGIAACFALIFAIGIAVGRNSGMEITQTLPPINTAETAATTSAAATDEVTTTIIANPPVTTHTETEPQAVKMTDDKGNEFSIIGTPINEENLSSFYYEDKYQLYLENYRNNTEFQKLLNQIPENDRAQIEETYIRATILANAAAGYEDQNWTEEKIKDRAKLNVVKQSDYGNYEEYYIETGASYDSFLKAHSDVFTDNTVKKLISREIWCPLSHNNELWIREFIGVGGDPSLVYSDYELVKASQDEIEFNRVYYYWESTMAVYYPWWKDMYSSCKIKNRLVKTENGWRAEELAFAGGFSVSETAYGDCIFDRVEKDGNNILNAFKETYLNNPTLSPLKSPWTEGKVTEAWEQIKQPHYGEGDLIIEESYTDRYFCDLDSDNAPELVMVSNLDSEINIFGINSSGNVTLKGKSEYDGHCRYINTTFVADATVLKEDLKHYYQYTEDFLTDRKFCIFTDSNGKSYIAARQWFGSSEVSCQIMELNLSKLKAYKKFDITPLYEWSFGYDWKNPEVNNTVIYRKYQPAENSSTLTPTEVTKDEVMNFIDTLKPAE